MFIFFWGGKGFRFPMKKKMGYAIVQNQKKKSLEIIRDASMSIVPRDWIEIWG
ncbi:Uncharacterized protein APZ42_018227 [Daphnia magna]|uniref:Uncharacterized protein n=1 Tax=Daphnia magna TaxID=35525 RepID=A0A164Z9A9_9CRUS|nr:Uncharacterized protein APZ42_018227 [Daphnia magna]